MLSIRPGRAPLRCCLFLVAAFGVDAIAQTVPTSDERTVTSKPARTRHVARHPGRQPHAGEQSDDGSEHGVASYYAHRFRGRRTASGEAYDPGALTAAHRTLPLGTQLRVVNPKNDRSVVVTVNDRGPVAKNRMLDVSSAAADRLDMKKSGVARVRTQVVGRVDPAKAGPVDAAAVGTDKP